jgi:hypothetical protein
MVSLRVLIAALTVVLACTPAARADDTQATCDVEGLTIALDPGLTTDIGAGTVRTLQRGTLSCEGTIDGEQVQLADPGTLHLEGSSYIGNCVNSTISGNDTMQIPTDQGTLNSTGTYTATMFGVGRFMASHKEFSVEGVGEATPIEGDCLTGITQLAIHATGLSLK